MASVGGVRVKPKPAWQQALEAAHLPLYDVHWSAAIVLSSAGDRGGARVGLADGRIAPLSSAGLAGRRGLNLYDVVFVKVGDTKSKQGRVDLRVRPTVQGAAVILDNKTGGILAMAGGFSYPVSQLNRVTEANPIEAFSELGSPAHSELIGILHQLASRPVVPSARA